MRRRAFLGLMLSAYLGLPIVQAQTRDVESPPPLPYVDEGACPFEGCHYGEWTARDSTAIRVKRDPSSAVAFMVVAGEKVQALTGAVVTRRAGRVLVKKSIDVWGWDHSITLPPGSVFFALHYLGEGVSRGWYRGTLINVELPDEREDGFFRVESDAEFAWWVQIKNGRGQIGWTDQADQFGGKDSLE